MDENSVTPSTETSAPDQRAGGVYWQDEAKRLLKAELAREGVTYKMLAKRLDALGIEDEESAIANRISRGKFSFIFFLQCMRALGVERLDLRARGRR